MSTTRSDYSCMAGKGGESARVQPVLHLHVAMAFLYLQVSVSGLLGGHSGLHIHEGRGNAVQLAVRAAVAALSATAMVSTTTTAAATACGAAPLSAAAGRLVEVQGGDKRNAIAREASALILVGACTHANGHCHTPAHVERNSSRHIHTWM